MRVGVDTMYNTVLVPGKDNIIILDRMNNMMIRALSLIMYISSSRWVLSSYVDATHVALHERAGDISKLLITNDGLLGWALFNHHLEKAR